MHYTTALVTGGSGFIGSHLVDALVAQGTTVHVIDLVEPAAERRNEKANYIVMDIRDVTIEETVRKIAPDVVFHLAAHIDDRASVLNPVMNAEHNEIGSINVFAAAQRTGVKTIIFASSSAVYGIQDTDTMVESMVPRPQTPYGISKFAGEMYLAAYHTQYGMQTVALRFANVYGPRQYGNKESGAIAIFTEKLLGNEPVFVNDDGKTTRDYVYVLDVVRALMAASQSEKSGVYNVGTNREVATQDLYDMIATALGSDVKATQRPEVRDAVKRIALDASRIGADLAWTPATTLEDGIAATIAWYREYTSIV